MRADDLAEDLPTDPLDGVEAAIGRATDALIKAQRDDGHWVFELEADATIPSEYILLRHYLGEPDDLELEAARSAVTCAASRAAMAAGRSIRTVPSTSRRR